MKIKILLSILVLAVLFGCGKKKNTTETPASLAASNEAKIDWSNVSAVYSTKPSSGSSAIKYGDNVAISKVLDFSGVKLLMKNGEVKKIDIGFTPKKIIHNQYAIVFTDIDHSQAKVFSYNGETFIFSTFSSDRFMSLTDGGLLVSRSFRDGGILSIVNLITGKRKTHSLNSEYFIPDEVTSNLVRLVGRDGIPNMTLDVETGRRINREFSLDISWDNNIFYQNSEFSIAKFDFNTFTESFIESKIEYLPTGTFIGTFENKKYFISNSIIKRIDKNFNVETFKLANDISSDLSRTSFSTDGNIAVIKENRAILIYNFETKESKRILEGFNIKTFDMFGKKIIFSATDNYGNPTSGIFELDTFKQTPFALNGDVVDLVVFVK